MRERFQGTIFGVNDGLPKSSAPLIQFFRKPRQLTGVGPAPLFRHLENTFFDLRAIQVLYPGEIGFKRLESLHLIINQPAWIKTPDRAVRKVPIAIVKTKALIDEQSGICGIFLVQAAEENDLAAITITGPLVKNESPPEYGS
jgi:hypothetical protein